MNRKIILTAALVIAAGAAYWSQSRPVDAPATATSAAPDAPMVEVTVPQLEGDALLGARAFEASCSACHGPNASGLDGKGPPLVHRIYEPGHHGDIAFLMAVENGVRSHHWPFGDMPPVQGLTRAEVASIAAYVRALQVANGI